jgi:serine/threonine protein kinase
VDRPLFGLPTTNDCGVLLLSRLKTIDLRAFQDDGSVGGSTGTKPANISSLTNPDRFREEAQIIAALEHPNILPVYAFGQEGDMLYIVMRYMPSGTLKDVLKQDPLSPQRAAEIMEPLAGALDLAHQHHIIHRDIKSANILLDAQLHPYLADFGLSMSKERATAEAGVGTLAYMSPEQMLGDMIDHRSDLYSFGILLYEVLTGSLPMYNNQAWNLHQAMSNVPLPVPDYIPSMVASVLRRATAVMPDERYQSAKEIIQALREAAADVEPITFEPEITDPVLLALREAQDLFSRAQ